MKVKPKRRQIEMNEEQDKADGKTDYIKLVKSYDDGDQMIIMGPTGKKKQNIDPIKDLVGVLNKGENGDE